MFLILIKIINNAYNLGRLDIGQAYKAELTMVKPNWDIFKAKFSENPQDTFEWFCYLLFCNEYDRPYGIFRYINQSAIETDPIATGKEVIGWQAKFYDTPLSNHKDELLSSIIKAKRDYPEISNLYFYSNKEWGQAKGKKPKGLVELEDKAKELKITLEWKTASFFESEFVTVENSAFSKHFFTQDNNAFDQMEEQLEHSKNILREIYTSISFNSKSIEIDRKKYVDDLIKSKQQVSILSGAGGIGKTVVIKKLFEELGDDFPFYVFKATEFELRNINNIFTNCSLNEFMDAHTHEEHKIIVIDSSEKLLDIRNQDPIQEFLSVCVKNKWKIIITTRNNYLEDLNYLFVEKYKISPLNLSVTVLSEEELVLLSKKYSFSLPSDDKLLQLLRTPFYLNEYLKFYKDNNKLAYGDFKKQLWNNYIKKSKPAREACFQEIAFIRANEGQFFVTPNCNSGILDNELVMDGILGNETAGYFITHDIYEEWALEKIINTEYIKKSGIIDFFEKIGQSLPVRRSFRNWISEQLFLEASDVKNFIEEVISDPDIQYFWKDEIVVSVLLSDYAEVFFKMFKEELLENDQKLLKRITFILRIACKEADDELSKKLGVIMDIKYLFTQPKGQGWKSLILFIYENIGEIGANNLNLIIPVVHDWNNKHKEGTTTKLSSLIALKYYQWHIEKNTYFSEDDLKEKTIQTIINGSVEIKGELKEIIDQIIKNEWKGHRSPYSGLVKYILTNINGLYVSSILPEQVLLLADFIWYEKQNLEKDVYFDDYHSSPEKDFCLLKDYQYQYFPSSAFQTPIYALLQSSFSKTIDFILQFTNRCVKCYANSKYEENIEEISVYINDKVAIKQFHSDSLWSIFRGTSSPVSPYLLQSIHMALEKHLLEVFKEANTEVIESWLIYLLKKSKSSSISSVVTSIVLAYPDKTFNVATILFKTKEFIKTDLSRCISESQAKSLYSMGGLNYSHKIYHEERLKTCEDEHRKLALENLFLNYQLFKSESISEEIASERQNILWAILDDYYKKLPSDTEEKDEDKVWRIFLARMDKRKMDFTATETDDGKIAIQMKSELEPDLKEYSENSISERSVLYQYASLKLWSQQKFENDKAYKKYEKYEENPSLAIEEAKSILKELKPMESSRSFLDPSNNDMFFLFNHATPIFVCSVLIRDYYDQLTDEEKDFCKKIILEASSLPFRQGYHYQISDGTQPAISVLPILLEKFDDEKATIKVTLLMLLFFEYHAGGLGNFSSFPIQAIQELWEKNFSDAQDILLGFLLLKPKYDVLVENVYQSNYSHDDVLNIFIDENDKSLSDVADSNLSQDCFNSDNEFSLPILNTAFQLIPNNTRNKQHKIILNNVFSTFSDKLLSHDSDDKISFEHKHSFLKKYAYFILSSDESEITSYLEPFLTGLNRTESVAELLEEFVLAEDALNTHKNFWLIWNLLKKKIYEICKDGDQYSYISNILRSYLFASVSWRRTAKEWRSFKESDKKFFKEVSKNLGHCPTTLYSITKLLNGIGSCYLDDGILWVSIILKNNDLMNKKLETNTIFYLENIVRKYILENREKIKRTKILKDEVLTILDFLIEKGSVVGYMLRESIV